MLNPYGYNQYRQPVQQSDRLRRQGWRHAERARMASARPPTELPHCKKRIIMLQIASLAEYCGGFVREVSTDGKSPQLVAEGFYRPGGDRLSHGAAPAVPLASLSLTAEFGMGSGVSSRQ